MEKKTQKLRKGISRRNGQSVYRVRCRRNAFPSFPPLKQSNSLFSFPSFLPSSLNLFISHPFLPISQSTFTSQSHHLPPISVPTPGTFSISFFLFFCSSLKSPITFGF